MKLVPQFAPDHARVLRPLGQAGDGVPSALQQSAHDHSSFIEEGGEYSVTRTGDYWVTADIKANGLEPYAYLRHVFTELPKAQSFAKVEALLPTRLAATASARDSREGSIPAARQ